MVTAPDVSCDNTQAHTGLVPAHITRILAVPTITFTEPDGSIRTVNAPSGETLMDCAVDNGIRGIDATCGGGCTCATCHCYIDPAWLDRLPPAVGDEIELLEFVWKRDARSRLACQVYLNDSLDGLQVQVPEKQV